MVSADSASDNGTVMEPYPPPTLGRGEGTATRRLPSDPRDISFGLSRIPIDNICV